MIHIEVSIVKHQSIITSIEIYQSIAIRIAEYQSIAISIAKILKYCNKYNKKVEVLQHNKILQYLLQNIKSVAINIAKYQSIVILYNTIGPTPTRIVF